MYWRLEIGPGCRSSRPLQTAAHQKFMQDAQIFRRDIFTESGIDPHQWCVFGHDANEDYCTTLQRKCLGYRARNLSSFVHVCLHHYDDELA